MDVGTSKGLESFLAFLRETTERHRMAEADRAEAEAATQDLLHALELGDDKAVGHITRATGLNLSGSLLDRFGEKLASDAAFAQVIRAANVYRGRLGYAPLGPDGWPEVET